MTTSGALLTPPARETPRTACTPIPVAACTRAPSWLFGDVVEAQVVGTYPGAVYLRRGSSVLPVLSRTALQLPGGVRIAPQEPWFDVRLGDVVRVGVGDVRAPGALLQVRRRVRPPRVPAGVLPAAARDRAERAIEEVLADGPGRGAGSDAAIVAAAAEVSTRAGAGLREAVSPLVGWGPGLTPSGDDVLCGLLLGLRATGRTAAADRLATTLETLLSRTTALSATLLRHAAEGYAVPQVVQLLHAWHAPDPCDPRDLGYHTLAVAAIGHCSGRDLLVGLRAALAAHRPAAPHLHVTRARTPSRGSP